MEKYKYDVPVFVVFFNRPDTLELVLESVVKAKPSKIFFCQDGARKNNINDKINVEKCRELVENINFDWQCKIYKDYSEENLGCGMRIFSGVKKAFEKVDRLIIIEDDIVVSESFFGFCEELLEKYKNDTRINMISGMNHTGISQKIDTDYFFSDSGSIWGWATWKRSWEQIEYEMPYIKQNQIIEKFINSSDSKREAKTLVELGKEKIVQLDRGERLSAWSYQNGMAAKLNNQINIVAKYNMVTNIGLTSQSVHAVDNVKKIPKGLQKVFFAERYEMQFPLKHPRYVINDKEYKKDVEKIMGWGYWRSKTRRVEGIIRQIVYGDSQKILKKLVAKVKKR